MRKADKNTQDIDFVITWVDGNDLEWKREKAARLGHIDMDISVNADAERLPQRQLPEKAVRQQDPVLPQ